MEECPSIAEATLGLTSLLRSSVAQVWQRSWKRIGGRPAFFRSVLKERFLRFEGLMIVPVSVAKVSPPGCQVLDGGEQGRLVLRQEKRRELPCAFEAELLHDPRLVIQYILLPRTPPV
jgi:hypothetical protein